MPFRVIVLLLLLAGCKPTQDQAASIGKESASANSVVTTQDSVSPPAADKSQYPFIMQWIPGQRDSADFAILSKYRAQERRVSPELVVLTLDTPAKDRKYSVADSVIVSGLPAKLPFKNDCQTDKIGSDGLIAGFARPDQGRKHPELAWVFDTVALKIRKLPADSVWCVQEEVD